MTTGSPAPDTPSPHAEVAVLERRIDLCGCEDKPTLLTRIASALQFPDWFGHNWDALSDCLTDLSWLPAPGYRIVLDASEALHAADPETLATALEILDEASAWWADEGISF
ncbi:barstar family protein, partial [Arthrospira platensis SPKY1]|nr:barstar family protein [Arthrospira platensis SPKY1]